MMGITRYTRKNATESQLQLYDLHDHTIRHTLTLEAKLSKKDKCHVFATADRLRRCGNTLTADLMKNYDQLVRTKKYRAILRAYGRAKEAGDAVQKKELGKKLVAMQKQYNVTWEFCRIKSKELWRVYKLKSNNCIARAEDIWYGMENFLYSDGGRPGFRKRRDLPAIRARARDSAITIRIDKEGRLVFKFGKIHFTYIDKPKDKFVNDELAAVLKYLRNPEENDRQAVEAYLKDGTLTDTYRPCFASLKCEIIRGKLRVFILLTIEGKPMKKYSKAHDAKGNVIHDSKGEVIYNPRHMYGTGNVGVDIGTQTIAYTSKTKIGLKNLAERGKPIKCRDAEERRLRRAMERSRKATNPDNFNPDGSYKKGQKTRIYSKRYMKLRYKLKELNRIAAENRHYAINEDVNRLRELGDVFITEFKNAAKEMKKAKPQSKAELADPHIKNKSRKRSGKSIRNRCPGYFQSRAKLVFESTGGRYVEVSRDFRASQYDHTADIYKLKEMSQRIVHLSDGSVVQRDSYSSFLLYNADGTYNSIDKGRCRKTFPAFYKKEQAMVGKIKKSRKRVMNSGIHPIKRHEKNIRNSA